MPMTLTCPVAEDSLLPEQADAYAKAVQEKYPDYRVSISDKSGYVTLEDNFLYTSFNDFHIRVLKLTTTIRKAADFGIDQFPDYFGDILKMIKLF